MANTKPAPNAPLGVDLGAYEEAADRIRNLNERLIESAKTAGNTTLDAYEKALRSLVDFEEKVAGASQLEWVSALAQTHAAFVRDVSSAYTRAARELLS
jgi:GTP cyclohydrolase III